MGSLHFLEISDLRMKFTLSLVVLVALVGGVFSYPKRPEHATAKGNVDCSQGSYPTPMSYHIHITYMLTNDDQINATAALRAEAESHFAPLLGDDYVCHGTTSDPSGRYDNGKLCSIYDHDITNDTLGPFAVGEWSFFVPVHYMNVVMPWFVQHRGEFTLLVHPNTGCENEDHSIWAQWIGPAWNMDMSIFTPYTQTESFGRYLGDQYNPVCLPNGGVCAFGVSPTSPAYAPQVVCCAGTACQCDGSSDGLCYCK